MTTTPWYWVTEDTKTFMSKGYLEKGETVEARVASIAVRFEELVNQMLKTKEPKFAKELADKFVKYMSLNNN